MESTKFETQFLEIGGKKCYNHTREIHHLKKLPECNNITEESCTEKWEIIDGNKVYYLIRYWFFVASYVVTDKNKLTKRDADNYIPN